MISLVGSFVLVHGFSALLPPIPEDEVSYYEIMDLSPSCSQDDVRKAYKKLSLQLHPDKVAQRGEDPEKAREEYQKVQEANTVLSHAKKRRRYDILNKSPTRYQFVSNNLNPGAMYENLTKASCCDKSRLVFLALLLCCLILLQPIMICAKINQDLRQEGVLYQTNWTVVLIPWWLFYGSLVVAHLVVCCMTRQSLFLLAFLEHSCWFIGQVLLAARWDGSISSDYKVVFVPFYLALFFRWTHKVLRLREIHSTLQRMVTLDYIESQVLGQGRTYQDLSQEEVQELQQQYVVVHVPPTAASLQEEEDKVQASPEYEHAVDTYTELMNSLIGGILVSIPFVALVVAKVDGAISASWWVVFIPIWCSLGCQILSSIYTCCCLPTVGEEVIGGDVVSSDDDNADGAVKDDDDDVFKDRTTDPSFDSVEGSIKRAHQDSAQKAPKPTGGSTPATDETPSSTDNGVKSDTVAPAKTDGKQSSSSKEETKQADVLEDIPVDPDQEEWSGIHIDDDMFREFESAYQEAEESAMEAQAKSQANCCSATFQLMMLCLLVGKLQRDYMRGENEKPGYNAFWILFPVFLVFGCALCTCACLIYSAGESEGFDHLVERATHKDDHDEENAEAHEAGNGDTAAAAAASKTEGAEEAKLEAEEAKEQHAQTKEPDSGEIDDLD